MIYKQLQHQKVGTDVNEDHYRYLDILNDEPLEDASLFNFEFNAQELTNMITSDIPTPFAILLNGEWGSGKTTLIKTTYKKFKAIKPVNWKLIYFNPWQYEGFDPRSALFVKIVEEYTSDPKKVAKNVMAHIPDIHLGVNLGIVSVNANPRTIANRYTNNIEKIDNLHKYFDGIVKTKLVVFIDDLDRCSIDNTLDILEAIKLFLSINGAIFIVAADIEKLEKAWELRYGSKKEDISPEAKKHIDKIFQLKLSIPDKNYPDLVKYFDSITNNFTEKPSETFRDIILEGCAPNPRAIKRVLNLYSIVKQIRRNGKEESKFSNILLGVIVLSVQYPELLRLIKSDPISFFELAHMAINFENHASFTKIKKTLGEIDYAKLRSNISPVEIFSDKGKYHIKDLSPVTIDGSYYLISHPYSFKLMRKLGANFGFYGKNLADGNGKSKFELEFLTKILTNSLLF